VIRLQILLEEIRICAVMYDRIVIIKYIEHLRRCKRCI